MTTPSADSATQSVATATDAVGSHLEHAGFTTTRASLLDSEVLIARRSDFRTAWMATWLHTFVVVYAATDLDEPGVEALTAAAQRYAIRHKGGMPRGLQTGTAALAVAVSADARPDLHEWFATEPRHRFAAMRFPVLLEVEPATAIYFTGRARKGSLYLPFLREVAEGMHGALAQGSPSEP